MLTREEVDECFAQPSASGFGKSRYDIAEMLISAVLEKLKVQEPFRWFYEVNGTWDICTKECPPDDAYDDGSLKPLYLHPLPPDDVVRDPRVAELEAVLRECRDVIEEAQTYCEGPQWSPSMAHDCGAAIAKIDEVLK